MPAYLRSSWPLACISLALLLVLGAPEPACGAPIAGRVLSEDLGRAAEVEAEPIGDTLTVIQRPLLNMPAFVLSGGALPILCEAPPSTTGWTAELLLGKREVPLTVTDTAYDHLTRWWTLSATVPSDVEDGLYDLRVTAEGGLDDTVRHAVKVLARYQTDYYFVHVTDPHLPTTMYFGTPGARADSSSMVDLREVIDDINLINPEFVLLTGDLVNEGELEDFEQYRYLSKAQRLLGELQVPVFLTSGNHDIGGWDATPPIMGTARRNWWRFFGWKRLGDPPAGAPARTQDYSFDYGPVHFVGLEAYINYDGWRPDIYGQESFTNAQMDWLSNDLHGVGGGRPKVLFYHYDFSRSLNLGSLGVTLGLWGHIHHDSGDPSAPPPYNLATGTTSEGHRTYRIVRVSNDTLTPLATVSAGSRGENLQVAFTAANDGSARSISAVVSNRLSIPFEHARIRFQLKSSPGEVKVEGGTLIKADATGSALVVTVGVNLAAQSVQVVSVSVGAPSLSLFQNVPNPLDFHNQTEAVIGFTLPAAGMVRLALFSATGRKVATVVDREMTAGAHAVLWDGRDERGRGLSSGVYLMWLRTVQGTRSRTMVLLR